MAKNKKLETDDFDFDAGMDMPDFDFDFKPPKDDRSPVTKFAAGALSGAKDTATSPEFIRRLVRDSLPKGYGQVMDLTDQGVGSLRNLYNTAAKELKPAITDIKRTTGKILPSVEGVLPKGVAERIREWSKEEKKPDPRAGVDQMREAGLQSDLTEIFGAQTELDQKNRAEDRATDAIRDTIQNKRHKDQMDQFGSMRMALQQGVAFDTKVTAKYQRKSLEIAYRQYFLQMDLLEETKRQNAVTTQNLEGILKNTGLPEFAKLKSSERLKEALRNKFIDGLNDSVFSKRREFLNNLGKRIAMSAQDKARNFASSVQQGAGMVDSLADLQAMQAEFGGPQLSGSELGGGIVGGLAADSAGERLGKWLRGKINKNDKIVRTGNKVSEFATNLPQHAKEFANSDKWENTGFGFLDSLIRFGKDNILGSLGGQDTSLHEDKLGDGNNPDVFGRRTNKSITEIIPGYLARIWREIRIMRTGDESTQLIEYDHMKNKFSDKKTIAKNIRESLVGDNETRYTKEQVDKLVTELDKDKKLTPEQRKVLGRYMLRENLSGNRGNVDRLSDATKYTGIAGAHGEAFADIFKEYFKEDPLLDKRRVFAQEFGNLGNRISDSRANIQHHVNAGNREYLEELGLVSNGMIDMNKLYDYYYGDDANPVPSAPGSITNPQRIRVSRTRGTANSRGAGPQGPRIINAPTPAVPAPQAIQQGAAQAGMTLQADPSLFNRIVEEIKAQSVKDEAKTMGETLLRIEQQIKDGIHLYEAGPSNRPGGARDWRNMRLSDVPGGLFGAAKDGLGWARKFGKRQFDNGLTRGKAAWQTLGGWKDKAWNKINELNDIYVKGELLPRITKAGIEAGKYRDQLTGKVITSYKDIKGAIIDEDGNIVLSMEDAKNAFMKTNLGQKALKGLTSLKDKAIGLGVWGAKKFRAGVGGIYGYGMLAAEKLWGLTDMAQDVYVKGEDKPRLLGITMKAGGYASRVSSKTITKPSQIDGPVYDQNGQIVLTEDDIKKGLVDSKGRPLVTGMKKVMQLALGAAKFLKDKAIWAKNKVMDMGRSAKDWVMGKLDFTSWGKKLGEFFNTGVLGISAKKTVDLLTDIRNILNDRLPGKKRKIEGDADGDGIRDGSYEDIKRKREKLKEKAGDVKDGAKRLADKGFAKSKDLYDTISDGAKEKAKAVMDFFRKRKHKGDDDEDDDGIGLDDLLDSDGRSRRRPRGRAGRAWGKTKGLAKRAGGRIGRFGRSAVNAVKNTRLGGLGRAAGSVGRGALGVARGGGSLLGRAAMWGGRGALALGGAGLEAAGGLAMSAVGGIGALASGAATAAGAIATGLGAVLTAPVLLTALGVAAIGAGAYFGYKYLTRKKLGLMSTLRYAQYGFTKDDDGDHLQKVFGLEDTLAEHVVFTGGQAAIDQSKVDLKKVISDFGLDPTNEEQRGPWVTWFASRFKPIFLAHMSVLAGMKKKLGDVDDLKGEERKQYFNAVKMPDGPYDYLVSPFMDLPRLKAGRPEVTAAIQAIQDDIAKNDKSGSKGVAAEAAKTTAAAAIGAAAPVLSADGVRKASPAEMQKLIKDTKFDASGAVLSGSGVVTVSSAQVMSDVLFSGRLDAVSAIRMKTYGLKDLSIDKVRTLQKLENQVLAQVSFASGDTASWNGSIEEMVNTAGPWFGVAGSTNGNSSDWLTWFSKRFLPTYLKYLTVLKKVSRKNDMKVAADTLNAQQQLDVGTVVYTTNTDYNGSSTSVWSITESPWPGYELNTDVKSVDGNLQALKDSAQQMKLDEQTGKTGKSGLTKEGASDVVQNGVTQKSGFFARFFKNVDEDGNKTNRGWFGNAAHNIGAGISGAANSIAQSLGFNGGREVEHPGKGTGGDINAIPKPTGKGSYASMKAMLEAVGKMTGVDPVMMASIMATESGFNPDAKAGTSSATGLGQFINDTWQTMLGKFGPKYGISPDTPATDPRANALMTAEFLKMNAEQIKGSVNRKLTDTDLYFAHFLGAGGARTFLGSDPSAIAANVMPKAARANIPIFYDQKNGNRPRTVGEVYALMNSRLRKQAKAYGVDDGSEKLQTASTSAPPPPPGDDKATKPSVPGMVSNPVGNFKVTEQTPGVPLGADTNVPQPVAPAKTDQPANASAAAGSAPSDPNAAARAAGQGFQTPRSASVDEQNRFQAQASSKAFEALTSVGTQQLETQKLMLEELRKLVAQGLGQAAKPEKAEAATPAVDPSNFRAPPRPVSSPPVPVTKKTNWP